MKELMPQLEKGDEIRIISTARKIDPSDLVESLSFLKDQGFSPSIGKHLYQSDHQFAGSDQERLEDLQDAIHDPKVKAIWLARGGYGTHRIIDQVSIESLKAKPKWIIGYSDVTVLHALLNANGIPSLHASMPINFKDQSLASFTGIMSVLKGSHPEYKVDSHPFNQNGNAKGKLVGGNLSIIYSLTGSSILPPMEDSILFFEDLDEYLYHVDRMMMNLKLSGVLSKIKGLIIGGMSAMNDNAIPFGKTAEEIIHEHIKDYEIPVCFGFPAGHQFENLALIFGKEVNLKVDNDSAKIYY